MTIPGRRNFFFKGHGLGNDYIVLDSSRLDFKLTRANIRLICSRNLGLGSDGIALRSRAPGADARMRIFNPDGSEAQKSGNGARIFALYLHRYGLPGRKLYRIQTAGGLIQARIGSAAITVDMGVATFKSRALPMRGPAREATRERLRVGGRNLTFTGVSVGNPHAVFFMPNLDPGLLRKLGPLIENHAMFPERTNVQFARAISKSAVKAIIWERGAGETMASGSSACAVAAAGRRLGFLAQEARVIMPGGTLAIGISPDWQITMRGPATEVATGTFSRDFLGILKSRKS